VDANKDRLALRQWRAPHERYRVDVPGAEGAEALSVLAFEAVERLGEPYRITIDLTHPRRLAREAYVGRNACFVLSPYRASAFGEDGTDDGTRRFHGCITHLSHLAASAERHRYRLVIEPHVARLRTVQASRVYQHQSAPQIIEAILRRHDFLGFQFRFRLRRCYPAYAFRLQYQRSEWDYLRLLMEQEGMYCYTVQEEHGDVLVFGDDIDHYLYQPPLALPVRAPAGLQAAAEAITALATHAHTVPKAFKVANYEPACAHRRLQAEDNRAWGDRTTYGVPYIYGADAADDAEALWQARLRHEAALAHQVVYEGRSTSPGLRAARVVRTDIDLPDSPHGMLVTEVVHRGARDRDYGNTFKAMPVDRRFRLPLDEARWPRIAGTLSARVTAAGDGPYAPLTAEGHYPVRLDLDFEPWPPGGESVPLRLAKPFAGQGRTGLHFPARAGDEAVIAFRDGDPNKPYIAAFHHNSGAPDLISRRDRWETRNAIRTRSDNTLQMEDEHGKEHVKLSTPHAGTSALTLGHLVDGRRHPRGEGFELRTSAFGALRAGGGLLVSTDDRAHGSGAQRDMQEAMAQWEATQAMAQSLADAARSAQAEIADLKAEKAWLREEVDQLKQAVMVLTSRKGVAIATPERMTVAAGKDVHLATSTDLAVSALKRVVMTAGQYASVFAQTGMKLLSWGKVVIQSQRDALAISALKDLSITSSNGRLILSAQKEVWIGAGGSYMRICGECIESGTPGDIFERCAQWSKQGAASVSPTEHLENQLPPTPLSFQTAASPASPNAMPAGMPYRLLADGVEIKRGVTDGSGRLPVDHQPYTRTYTLELANGVSYRLPVAETYRGDAANGERANQGFHFHQGAASADIVSPSDRALHRQRYAAWLKPDQDTSP